jgi:hypothetical protein
MNQLSSTNRIFLVAFFFAAAFSIQAQPADCTLKPPLITINFGSGKVYDANDAPIPNYSLVWNTCPEDGFYTYAAATSDCFYGDWFTLSEDHTPGDGDGNMMLVNATPQGGIFFHRVLEGLQGGVTYNFTSWLMNVCRIKGGCPPLPPNILVKLTTPSRKVVMQFMTGQLVQTAAPRWTSYSAYFTMPTGETQVVLTMVNTTTGGCGNDFALDDITIREWIKPETFLNSLARRAGQAIKQQVALKKPERKQEPIKEEPMKPANRATQVRQQVTERGMPEVVQREVKPMTSRPIPAVLSTRENPLVKQIETAGGEIRIDLYDNGVVDGDTVSVYHNNELIVSGVLLSQKPITFRIRVEAGQPRHELIMVAHNLGSIPPNTSLMIVTAGDQRHEAFLSSSELKNAKVVITLKE